jgi:hypothetical protein
MLTFNEGRACDAIVQILEERTGVQRSNVRWHDKDPQGDRNVELTFNLGADLYAMEHTGIEPFDDFMKTNNTSRRLFDPIISAVSSAVPSNEVIDLSIPAGALTHRKKDLGQIQQALVRFVLESAAKLPLRRYDDWRGVEATMPSGVPFDVRIARFASPIARGQFHLTPLVTGNVELLRADRIRRACQRKFPKLAKWKVSHNARTVLVLENNDIWHTNHMVVTNAYLKAASARDDRPDETYVVETHAPGGTWFACPILIDGESYYDLSEKSHPIHREFNSAKLTAITRDRGQVTRRDRR